MFHRLGFMLNREARRGVAPSKTPLLPRLRKKGVRLIHNNQKGFTMIEVVLAIALTGIITGGITMSIFQVFDGNARTSNHMAVVRQVQNVGYWISHDVQQAQSVEPADPDPDGFPLVLTWTEWDGTRNEVVYTLLVNDKLQREHYINYDPVTNPNPDTTTFVAEYIDSIEVVPRPFTDGGVLTLRVTAKVGTGSQEASETRVYEITPRPSM